MKYFLILLGLIPLSVHSVPDLDVYPNSGPTDAKVDENTGISSFPNPPAKILRTTETLEEETMNSPKKKDEFVQGPYGRNGNYRYVPEVRVE